MTSLVQDLTVSMEQDPPPFHSLGAHLMKAQYASGTVVCHCYCCYRSWASLDTL